MLIHYGSRLRAAVSVQAVEVDGRNAMVAISAFKCESTIHWFCCVISHISIVGPSTDHGIGQEVCILRVRNRSVPVSALTMGRPVNSASTFIATAACTST
jgi:hypothetical protein